MTTRDEARRRAGELSADDRRGGVRDRASVDADPDADTARNASAAGGSALVALPERLYAARERKGVDLYRAERDTKIRARYLAALERGEYKELPGDVYTKGFLRNYALYLGLDPEEVVGQWRRERGDEKTPRPILTVPRPIAQPRPGLQFSTGIIVAALLTILIVGVGVWLTIQVLRFNKPPTIAVTSPREATLQLDENATSYTLQGMSIPGATITIELAGGNRQISADSTGAWSVGVDLRRGKNEFKIDATDPETGRHADQAAMVVIVVPSRAIEAPTLTIDQPADGTTFENGAIPVQGTATNATSVSIAATFEGPATGTPAASALPSSPPGPAPITVTVADDGTWNTGSTPLQLTTGRWSIVATASNAAGKAASLTRHVSIAYKGVTLVVAAKGGPAWVKVWVDGKLDATFGRSGKTLNPGDVLTFTGQTSVEVRTGSSGATSFTLNGQQLGALGRRGIPETWLFQPPAGPVQTQHQ
ncbi:MAG TPA: RodZ domain-containing protein [Candidatus Limnocylindrales bacterium]|nr:RodZ domain-containing protein [Candidatus Limnocylindrales bacterium]